MKRIILLLALVGLMVSDIFAQDLNPFYVATYGNDNWSGTKEKPFLTLLKAIESYRKLERSDTTKRIIMRGGKYYEVSLVLGPEDSNLAIEAYPGEKPILYGGQLIRNWEKESKDFYAAQLPSILDKKLDFRILIANDRLCERARLPKDGYFQHRSKWDVPWLSTTAGGWQRKPTLAELSTMKYKPGDLGSWLDIKNAELTIYHQWDESAVGIKSIDFENQMVVFSTPSGHPPGAWNRNYVVWNIREGMQKPGQWYLDRTAGKIVYWPMAGEDMREIEVVVPTAETIIRISGTKVEGVKNITLKGLILSVTNTPLVAGGWAAGIFEGALSVDFASNCQLNDITVTNVGGQGMKIQNCDGIRIESCDINMIGAGGVYCLKTNNTVVTNSHIHDIGIVYPSGIGLRINGKNNIVSHNEINNVSYTGIEGTAGPGVSIENNLIYNFMKVLHDGAAIYISFCKDIVVRGNVVQGGEAVAYYMDEQAENCIVENNLAENTLWPSHNHMVKNCIIRNNVFIDKEPSELTFPRSQGLVFEHNIVCSEESVSIEMAPGVVKFSNNIFFSGISEVWVCDLEDYKIVKEQLRKEENDIFVDPMFVNRKEGDYNFLPSSLAAKLGIKTIEKNKAGRIINR